MHRYASLCAGKLGKVLLQRINIPITSRLPTELTGTREGTAAAHAFQV
jgi:hypothetical protein